MKILIICGTYPPERCGIGDYVHNIVAEIENYSNHQISVLANLDWSNRHILSIIKKVKGYKADVIHIQYPGQSYGLSLVPHILSIYFRTIVTLHEVSHSKFIRRLSLLFFSLRSKVIFTNTYENNNFKKLFPWYQNTNTIIPIGSNVNCNLERYDSKIITKQIESKTIVYFGQIRPKKGIEDLLQLGFELGKTDLDLRVLLMGEVLPAFSEYWRKLQTDTRSKYVEFRLNVSFSEISSVLSSSSIAYFPFPDGVSERRGSVFAALSNHIPVFTTRGMQTTSEIEEIVDFVDSPTELVYKINTVGIDNIFQRMHTRKVKIDRFLSECSWETISKKHIVLYDSFVKYKKHN